MLMSLSSNYSYLLLTLWSSKYGIEIFSYFCAHTAWLRWQYVFCPCLVCVRGGGKDMVCNATFNNISVISWQSVLLVEETRSTLRKPRTCRKSLTNFITYSGDRWSRPGRSLNQVRSLEMWHNIISNTPRLSRIRNYDVSYVCIGWL